MKYLTLKIAISRLFYLKNWVHLLVTLPSLLFFIISCEKDKRTTGTSKYPPLTIEKAKELFAQTEIREFESQDRDDDEYDAGFYMRLGWNNGSEYHDERHNLDVVEIPILESTLSKKFQVEDASLKENGYANNGEKEILLVTQDTAGGIKMTILKISGTIAYLTNNEIKENSFKKIDNDFEGLVEYYTLDDSLLKGYLIRDGNIHEVIDSHEWDGTQDQPEDRWAYCIVGWLTIRPCTGPRHHTCDNKEACPCGKSESSNCQPPLCVPILEECGGPPINSDPGGTSHGNPELPPPPGMTWGHGGNYPGPGQHCGCLHHVIDQFYINCRPDLDGPFSNYWFNINWVVLNPNCQDGNYDGGTYKVYLVPGQLSNGQEIDYNVAMNYVSLDYRYPVAPCKYEVALMYSGTVTFYATWAWGGLQWESQWVHLYESDPTFIFD